MFEEHPSFPQPQDSNMRVWRYMDLAKFVAMLDSKSLWFSAPVFLGDRFEGSLSRPSIVPDNTPVRIKGTGNLLEGPTAKDLRLTSDMHLTWKFINCWHLNEYESAAMWSSYVSSGQGVAIVSSYRKLSEAADRTTLPGPFVKLYGGLVRYIDYERDRIDESTVFNRVMAKRLSFEHEREVRLAFHLPQYGVHGEPSVVTGRPIAYDLQLLIDAVYVAPESNSMLVRVVESLLKRYGLPGKPVHLSSLDDGPLS